MGFLLRLEIIEKLIIDIDAFTVKILIKAMKRYHTHSDSKTKATF